MIPKLITLKLNMYFIRGFVVLGTFKSFHVIFLSVYLSRRGKNISLYEKLIIFWRKAK